MAAPINGVYTKYFFSKLAILTISFIFYIKGTTVLKLSDVGLFFGSSGVREEWKYILK